MKSYLVAILFSASLSVTACAVAPDDDLAVDESALSDGDVDVRNNPLFESSSVVTNPLFQGSGAECNTVAPPTPNGEEIWWRCSTTHIPYPTKPFCQSECPGGTCHLTLVCTNDSTGQQIPCP